jgi:hypothetical protein
MKITIHKVKKVGVNPNQAIAIISSSDLEDGEPFGYFIALDKEDESEISNYILEEIKKGNVKVEELISDLTEYKSSILREHRNKLLNETDKFMVIDSILSDDEIKEVKEYRSRLRNISTQKSFPNVDLPQLPSFLIQTDTGVVEYQKKNDK